MGVATFALWPDHPLLTFFGPVKANFSVMIKCLHYQGNTLR
jgi:hypothetical protein